MTGALSINSDLNLRGTTNYVTLRANSATSTYTMTLPTTAGTSGHVLTTDGSGVLTWTNPSSVTTGTGTVNSASITDGSIVDADINASANIAQSKIANLTTDLAGKESTITAGTSAQYYKGDKTWAALNTDAVAEATNLYFTEPRVLGTDLSGFSATNAVIADTDTILQGFNKTQGQINAINTTISGMGASQWSESSGNVYRSTGNVGIGTSSPS